MNNITQDAVQVINAGVIRALVAAVRTRSYTRNRESLFRIRQGLGLYNQKDKGKRKKYVPKTYA